MVLKKYFINILMETVSSTDERIPNEGLRIYDIHRDTYNFLVQGKTLFVGDSDNRRKFNKFSNNKIRSTKYIPTKFNFFMGKVQNCRLSFLASNYF